MIPEETMKRAISALADARKSFREAVSEGLILGNDNHIGDIGEYWVRRYYQETGDFSKYATEKNSLFDIELLDGTLVSVKTMTSWADGGRGTQIKPLCGNNWQVLAAVMLNEQLEPDRIAIVPLSGLISHEPFPSNINRRETQGTLAHPKFQWWDWLDDYQVYP